MTDETLQRLHALMDEIRVGSAMLTSRIAKRHVAFAHSQLAQVEFSLRVALQAEATGDAEMKRKTLKVYGWTAHISKRVREQLELPGHIVQARAIVAAPSMAAVGRLLGVRPRTLFNLSETGNALEIQIATALPQTFFASPLDGPKRFQVVEPGDVR